MWDEITYAFPNFNSCTVEVWEWISNFGPHLTVHVITYRCWDWLNHVSEGPLVVILLKLNVWVYAQLMIKMFYVAVTNEHGIHPLPSITINVVMYYYQCCYVIQSMLLCITINVVMYYHQCWYVLPSMLLCITINVFMYYHQCCYVFPPMLLVSHLWRNHKDRTNSFIDLQRKNGDSI